MLDADPSLRTLVTDAGQLPDRPLRARGDRARPRPGAGDLRGADPLLGPQPDDVPGRLVVLSHVAYRSGALADMAALERAARSSGTSSHSAGAVPGRPATRRHPLRRRLHLQVPQRRARARPATCTSREPDALRTPIQGWFGQDDQFAMERPYAPAPGHHALPRRHAADPRPGRGRGGRADHRRGGHRGAAREVDRPDAS